MSTPDFRGDYHIYRYLRFEYLHHSADSGLVNYPNQIDGREARRIINNLKGGK